MKPCNKELNYTKDIIDAIERMDMRFIEYWFETQSGYRGMTLEKLRAIASVKGIQGVWSMNKDQLIYFLERL